MAAIHADTAVSSSDHPAHERRLEQCRRPAESPCMDSPLGGGSVESANKLVVQARLTGAGKRYWRS
jgi:hypothetical protein